MRVVIVDDTNINLVLMSHLVKKLDDVEAITFQSASEALTWCAGNVYDLLILDYMMPELNGLDFMSRLLASAPPDTAAPPILMVTASHDIEIRHQALESGATDFLTKPIDKVEFLARTRNMLQLRKANVTLQNQASWLTEEVKKATAAILAREQETIWLLCKASEYRDPETGAHILRMAHYSRLIAKIMGLPEEEQELIFKAAPMHDIGKVATPDNILLKPGRLTDEEMAIMKQHAEVGYQILSQSNAPLLKVGAEIARNHHERFDGQGYPHQLRGKDIPLVGRIVAVADVFDALTSERPYKKAWSLEDARQHLLNNSGTHFDPDCVNAFLSDWSEITRIRNAFQDEPLVE